MVMGKGRIDVDGVGSCDSEGNQHGDCTWQVAYGVALSLHAVATNPGHDFMMWLQPITCAGGNPSCGVTPYLPTTAVGKFK